MGMLFNTEQTVKMVALVNRHFAAKQRGGGMEDWRSNAADLNPNTSTATLWAAAFKYNVLPSKSEDFGGGATARWKKWLNNQLSAVTTNSVQDPSKPSGGNWAVSFNSTYTVENEIRRQIFNALNDSACVEICFTVVPSTSISVGNGVCIPITREPPVPGAYIYSLTVYTKRIQEI
jgi:hypothetical protein